MTGRVIAGRYNLAEPIGRGAMGVVWRARDVLLDREVAVKEVVLNAAIGEDERQNAYQRTLREARTAARLSHRGVVTVYDVAEEDGRPWIVMELVPSRSLEQVLFTDGPLPPRRAGRIGQQLLAALAAAHAAGVLHRDVKPSNVLIAPDGYDSERAVLTDFGIAQFEGDPRLTQTGMVMGSPGFTAPERIRGSSATSASDLWSLGATIYAAIEGRGPYEQRGGAITTMTAIINEDAPIAPSAGRLAPLIAALLRREPMARPSAARAARMFAEVIPMLPDQRADSVRRTPTLLSSPNLAPTGVATSSDAASDVASEAADDPASDAADLGEETIATAEAPPASDAEAESEAPAAAAASEARSEARSELPDALDPDTADHNTSDHDTPDPDTSEPDTRELDPTEVLPNAKPPVWASQFWREEGEAGESGGIVREKGSGLAQPGPTFSAARPPARPAAPHAPDRQPKASPRSPTASPRRRRGRVVGIVAVAVVVVIAAVVVLLTQRDGPSTAAKAATGTSTAPNGSQPSAVQAIDSPLPKTPSGWSTDVVPAAVDKTASGARIGLPPGWQSSQSGLQTVLAAPDGVRSLEIDLTAHHFRNMVTEAKYIEQVQIAAGALPGYQRLSIEPEQIRGTAGALWSFTWVRRSGVTMRADDLLFTLPTAAGPQSYAIYFTAPSTEFGSSQGLTFFNKILRTFEPSTDA